MSAVKGKHIMWIQPKGNFDGVKAYSLHGGTRTSANSVGVCDVRTGTHAHKQDVFYDEMMPLWIVFKFLGLFPMQKPEPGVTTFRWMSKQMLYALCFFVVVNLTMVFKVITIMKDSFDEALDSDDVILIFSTSLYTLPLIILPACHWLNAHKVVDLMNNWVSFQDKFYQVTRNTIQLEIRRKTLMLVSLSIAAAFAMSTFQYLMLTSVVDPMEILWYGYAVTILNIHLLLWYSMCTLSARTASKMMHFFNQDFTLSHGSNSELVSKYRVLWLQLSRMTQEFGVVFCSHFQHTTLLYVSLNLISFYNVLVYSDFQGEYRLSVAIITAVAVLFLTSSLFIFSLSAHNATNQVGKAVSDQLQMLTSDNADTQNMLQHFEYTIFMNPPVISLGAYVDVNRKMVTTIFATTLTYLVVLLQYKINELSSNSHGINNSSLTGGKEQKLSAPSD